MSTYIKDLYDYDLFKEGRVCQNILLKVNFHKKQNLKMDYNLDLFFLSMTKIETIMIKIMIQNLSVIKNIIVKNVKV